MMQKEENIWTSHELITRFLKCEEEIRKLQKIVLDLEARLTDIEGASLKWSR